MSEKTLTHPLAKWAAERCDLAQSAEALAVDLFEDFAEWAFKRGAPSLTPHKFGSILHSTPGVTATTFRRNEFHGRGWRGIELKATK